MPGWRIKEPQGLQSYSARCWWELKEGLGEGLGLRERYRREWEGYVLPDIVGERG